MLHNKGLISGPVLDIFIHSLEFPQQLLLTTQSLLSESKGE